eukprot:gnl/TRDRNA2_/TRDRNA2_193539_c0_seq1.p1 gnl/TRDRNA2_/TRDRNA2_193539_c0~~gnl/TRDRNA2_/TRDRNA2_193539_c0_seq1.p1  ORF type:complete len:361 (-),score=32.76 gnl/TRDRNA2_/TRDRNA2_193539_c0_seq1:158-1240(-)
MLKPRLTKIDPGIMLSVLLFVIAASYGGALRVSHHAKTNTSGRTRAHTGGHDVAADGQNMCERASDTVNALLKQTCAKCSFMKNSTEPCSLCTLRAVAEANAIRKMHERTAFLQTKPVRFQNWTAMPADNWNAALLFSSVYPCFWTLEKSSSVATQWDGGKWMCGLREMGKARPTTCVAYSIGSNFDSSFEEHVSEATGSGCEIHIYDPTMGTNRARLTKWVSKLPLNFHFHELGIVGDGINATFPSTTLKNAFRQNNHSAIDILKFDIESYEYELLDTVDWAELQIGMISFELHTNLISRRLHKTYTVQTMNFQFARLEAAGYRIYSVEPVAPGNVGQVEVAMIHKDWDPSCGFHCSSC